MGKVRIAYSHHVLLIIYCLLSNQNRDGLQFANIEELLLQRVDNLDDMARKTLHFAAVLGMTFSFNEILEISEHILSISEEGKEKHAIAIHLALQAAVDEGIIDEIVEDDERVDEAEDTISSMMINFRVEADGGADDTPANEHEGQKRSFDRSGGLMYIFYHDMWRRVISSLLLNSRKRDIHKHAAMAIETRFPDEGRRDYRTKVKLFRYWKESGNSINASKLALDIGQSFKLLGLNLHSISVYEDALDMWKKHDPMEGEDTIGGKLGRRIKIVS